MKELEVLCENWLSTPYCPGMARRGVGVDTLGFVVGVLQLLGVVRWDVGWWSDDWWKQGIPAFEKGLVEGEWLRKGWRAVGDGAGELVFKRSGGSRVWNVGGFRCGGWVYYVRWPDGVVKVPWRPVDWAGEGRFRLIWNEGDGIMEEGKSGRRE